MKPSNKNLSKNIRKYWNYMFGGLFSQIRSSALVGFVVILGFVEFFIYVASTEALAPPDTFSRFNFYLFFVILSILSIRLAVAMRVEKIMYTDLTQLADAEKQAQRTEAQRKDTEKTTAPPVEVRAAAMPGLNVTGNEIINDKQVTALREALIKKARSVYFLAMRRDLAASLTYIVFIAIQLTLGENIILFDPLFAFQACFLGLLLVFLRFFFHSRQFRPLNAGFQKIRHPVFELISAISHPQNHGLYLAYISILAVYSMVSGLAGGYPMAMFGAVVMVGAHYAWLRFMKPSNDRNIKLLILRTFQINRNTAFTFEKLARFWKHVGSIFTIVDSSYLLYSYRFFSPRNLLYMVLLFAVLAVGMFTSLNPFITVLIMLAVLGAIITFENYSIELNVIKTREGFLERLNRFLENPRSLADLTFMSMPTVNYGNVWDKSVSELIHQSELVLMDLRGFSQEKKGCEFEINLLMDNKPIDRVLFLISINDKPNFEIIEKTINAKWEFQLQSSPNLKLNKPVVQVYLAIGEDEKDVQGLMDRLLAMEAAQTEPV